MLSKAQQFGRALDKDDFETARGLLSQDCKYHIGDEVLIGPIAIAGSYEANMLEGRKKLDQLVWGDSEVVAESQTQFIVHFTDFLTHQGESHVHRCRQRITFDRAGAIARIDHLADEIERAKLDAFYQRVGLK